MDWLTKGNVATVLVLVFAVVGGVLVIISTAGHVDPDVRLSFSDYLQSMAIAAGGLAIGRGLTATRRGSR